MESFSDKLGVDRRSPAAEGLSAAGLIRLPTDWDTSQKPRPGFDRFAARLRSIVLHRMLAAWLRARQGEALPQHEHVCVASEDRDFVAHVVVNETHVPMSFELTKVGAELMRRAETDFHWWELDAAGENADTSQEGAYRRCVRSKTPAYDFAGFDFGPGGRTFYERLLLPCSDDGVNVTSLIVVVDFDENPEIDEA